jgi:predicted nucleotide-binding protein
MTSRKIEILESMVMQCDKIRMNTYDAFYNQIATYIDTAFGKSDLERLEKLNRGYSYYEESSGSIKGYLLGLIARLESDDVMQNNSAKTSETAHDNKKINGKEIDTIDSPFVFVVHGHDNESKETVARFIEKMDLNTIILHEQPNSGKTIIEKFEDFAQKVAYAVILLTPDDIATSRKDMKSYKFRARQNVIYELGFFNAKLGRGRVCALCKSDPKGDIELPSDFLGVVYVPLDDAGAWKMKLAKEMKEAGLKIILESVL